uniref:Uncharacterized protein n=1 Tax=Anguilla anguilla TaxID=7936 RepID=A0A0E9U006_ANGAN
MYNMPKPVFTNVCLCNEREINQEGIADELDLRPPFFGVVLT